LIYNKTGGNIMPKTKWAKTTPRSTDEAAIIQEGLEIKANLTGNTNFAGTETIALLATFVTALTAFQAARTAAANGGKDLTAAKEAKKAEYLIALLALGRNVNSVVNVANSSVVERDAKLTTSGFPLVETNHTAQPLDAPENLRASSPQIGMLVVRVNKVKNARTYKWLYKEETAAVWSELPEFKTKTKLVLLVQDGKIQSGKRYIFRVAGQGADPTENFSPELLTGCVQ
jgi:hypothetical protein